MTEMVSDYVQEGRRLSIQKHFVWDWRRRREGWTDPPNSCGLVLDNPEEKKLIETKPLVFRRNRIGQLL